LVIFYRCASLDLPVVSAPGGAMAHVLGSFAHTAPRVQLRDNGGLHDASSKSRRAPPKVSNLTTRAIKNPFARLVYFYFRMGN
jgi:hypothetical protein